MLHSKSLSRCCKEVGVFSIGSKSKHSSWTKFNQENKYLFGELLKNTNEREGKVNNKHSHLNNSIITSTGENQCSLHAGKTDNFQLHQPEDESVNKHTLSKHEILREPSLFRVAESECITEFDRENFEISHAGEQLLAPNCAEDVSKLNNSFSPMTNETNSRVKGSTSVDSFFRYNSFESFSNGLLEVGRKNKCAFLEGKQYFSDRTLLRSFYTSTSNFESSTNGRSNNNVNIQFLRTPKRVVDIKKDSLHNSALSLLGSVKRNELYVSRKASPAVKTTDLYNCVLPLRNRASIHNKSKVVYYSLIDQNDKVYSDENSKKPNFVYREKCINQEPRYAYSLKKGKSAAKTIKESTDKTTGFNMQNILHRMSSVASFSDKKPKTTLQHSKELKNKNYSKQYFKCLHRMKEDKIDKNKLFNKNRIFDKYAVSYYKTNPMNLKVKNKNQSSKYKKRSLTRRSLNQPTSTRKDYQTSDKNIEIHEPSANNIHFSFPENNYKNVKILQPEIKSGYRKPIYKPKPKILNSRDLSTHFKSPNKADYITSLKRIDSKTNTNTCKNYTESNEGNSGWNSYDHYSDINKNISDMSDRQSPFMVDDLPAKAFSDMIISHCTDKITDPNVLFIFNSRSMSKTSSTSSNPSILYSILGTVGDSSDPLFCPTRRKSNTSEIKSTTVPYSGIKSSSAATGPSVLGRSRLKSSNISQNNACYGDENNLMRQGHFSMKTAISSLVSKSKKNFKQLPITDVRHSLSGVSISVLNDKSKRDPVHSTLKVKSIASDPLERSLVRLNEGGINSDRFEQYSGCTERSAEPTMPDMLFKVIGVSEGNVKSTEFNANFSRVEKGDSNARSKLQDGFSDRTNDVHKGSGSAAYNAARQSQSMFRVSGEGSNHSNCAKRELKPLALSKFPSKKNLLIKSASTDSTEVQSVQTDNSVQNQLFAGCSSSVVGVLLPPENCVNYGYEYKGTIPSRNVLRVSVSVSNMFRSNAKEDVTESVTGQNLKSYDARYSVNSENPKFAESGIEFLQPLYKNKQVVTVEGTFDLTGAYDRGHSIKTQCSDTSYGNKCAREIKTLHGNSLGAVQIKLPEHSRNVFEEEGIRSANRQKTRLLSFTPKPNSKVKSLDAHLCRRGNIKKIAESSSSDISLTVKKSAARPILNDLNNNKTASTTNEALDKIIDVAASFLRFNKEALKGSDREFDGVSKRGYDDNNNMSTKTKTQSTKNYQSNRSKKPFYSNDMVLEPTNAAHQQCFRIPNQEPGVSVQGSIIDAKAALVTSNVQPKSNEMRGCKVVSDKNTFDETDSGKNSGPQGQTYSKLKANDTGHYKKESKKNSTSGTKNTPASDICSSYSYDIKDGGRPDKHNVHSHVNVNNDSVLFLRGEPNTEHEDVFPSYLPLSKESVMARTAFTLQEPIPCLNVDFKTVFKNRNNSVIVDEGLPREVPAMNIDPYTEGSREMSTLKSDAIESVNTGTTKDVVGNVERCADKAGEMSVSETLAPKSESVAVVMNAKKNNNRLYMPDNGQIRNLIPQNRLTGSNSSDKIIADKFSVLDLKQKTDTCKGVDFQVCSKTSVNALTAFDELNNLYVNSYSKIAPSSNEFKSTIYSNETKGSAKEQHPSQEINKLHCGINAGSKSKANLKGTSDYRPGTLTNKNNRSIDVTENMRDLSVRNEADSRHETEAEGREITSLVGRSRRLLAEKHIKNLDVKCSSVCEIKKSTVTVDADSLTRSNMGETFYRKDGIKGSLNQIPLSTISDYKASFDIENSRGNLPSQHKHGWGNYFNRLSKESTDKLLIANSSTEHKHGFESIKTVEQMLSSDSCLPLLQNSWSWNEVLKKNVDKLSPKGNNNQDFSSYNSTSKPDTAFKNYETECADLSVGDYYKNSVYIPNQSTMGSSKIAAATKRIDLMLHKMSNTGQEDTPLNLERETDLETRHKQSRQVLCSVVQPKMPVPTDRRTSRANRFSASTSDKDTLLSSDRTAKSEPCDLNLSLDLNKAYKNCAKMCKFYNSTNNFVKYKHKLELAHRNRYSKTPLQSKQNSSSVRSETNTLSHLGNKGDSGLTDNSDIVYYSSLCSGELLADTKIGSMPFDNESEKQFINKNSAENINARVTFSKPNCNNILNIPKCAYGLKKSGTKLFADMLKNRITDQSDCALKEGRAALNNTVAFERYSSPANNIDGYRYSKETAENPAFKNQTLYGFDKYPKTSYRDYIKSDDKRRSNVNVGSSNFTESLAVNSITEKLMTIEECRSSLRSTLKSIVNEKKTPVLPVSGIRNNYEDSVESSPQNVKSFGKYVVSTQVKPSIYKQYKSLHKEAELQQYVNTVAEPLKTDKHGKPVESSNQEGLSSYMPAGKAQTCSSKPVESDSNGKAVSDTNNSPANERPVSYNKPGLRNINSLFRNINLYSGFADNYESLNSVKIINKKKNTNVKEYSTIYNREDFEFHYCKLSLLEKIQHDSPIVKDDLESRQSANSVFNRETDQTECNEWVNIPLKCDKGEEKLEKVAGSNDTRLVNKQCVDLSTLKNSDTTSELLTNTVPCVTIDDLCTDLSKLDKVNSDVVLVDSDFNDLTNPTLNHCKTVGQTVKNIKKSASFPGTSISEKDSSEISGYVITRKRKMYPQKPVTDYIGHKIPSDNFMQQLLRDEKHNHSVRSYDQHSFNSQHNIPVLKLNATGNTCNEDRLLELNLNRISVTLNASRSASDPNLPQRSFKITVMKDSTRPVAAVVDDVIDKIKYLIKCPNRREPCFEFANSILQPKKRIDCVRLPESFLKRSTLFNRTSKVPMAEQKSEQTAPFTTYGNAFVNCNSCTPKHQTRKFPDPLSVPSFSTSNDKNDVFQAEEIVNVSKESSTLRPDVLKSEGKLLKKSKDQKPLSADENVENGNELTANVAVTNLSELKDKCDRELNKAGSNYTLLSNLTTPSNTERLMPINKVQDFPLLNNRKSNLSYVLPDGGIVTMNYTTIFSNAELRKIPSVTKILNATMSEKARTALEKWKKQMIEDHGVEGFESLNRAKLQQGSDFHDCIRQHLLGSSVGDLDTNQNITKLLQSVKLVLKNLSSVSVIESHVIHSQLPYRGIIDCVAKYNGKPAVIEWKHSDKKKRYLKWTYDAPVQMSAYLGALNYDENYKIPVDSGMVIVAYTDGSPADVFWLSQDLCQRYWKIWLSRLQQFLQTHTNV